MNKKIEHTAKVFRRQCHTNDYLDYLKKRDRSEKRHIVFNSFIYYNPQFSSFYIPKNFFAPVLFFCVLNLQFGLPSAYNYAL